MPLELKTPTMQTTVYKLFVKYYICFRHGQAECSNVERPKEKGYPHLFTKKIHEILANLARIMSTLGKLLLRRNANG
jgi:hypothetical protein